jgi:hypothetical protein
LAINPASGSPTINIALVLHHPNIFIGLEKLRPKFLPPRQMWSIATVRAVTVQKVILLNATQSTRGSRFVATQLDLLDTRLSVVQMQ